MLWSQVAGRRPNTAYSMLQLIQESFEPYNLPFTILLFAVAGYWVIGLFGLVDMDALDGVDGVEGVDGDASGADTEVDGGDGFGHAVLHGLFKLVGASDAPLIFIISLFSLFLWAFNVAGNHYFNPAESASVSSMMLIPVIIGAFVFTRLLVRPLRPLMNMLKHAEEPVVIVGASGSVRSATLDCENYGQIEVETGDRSLLLRARLSEKAEPLPKGARVLVVSHDSDNEAYIVRPLN